MDELLIRIDKQRADFDAGGLPYIQILQEIGRCEACADDVLDDQDVLAGDIDVEVLGDADDSGLACGGRNGADRDYINADRDVNGACQICEEVQGTLQDADYNKLLAGIVRTDLFCETGDRCFQLFRRIGDPAYFQFGHRCTSYVSLPIWNRSINEMKSFLYTILTLVPG